MILFVLIAGLAIGCGEGDLEVEGLLDRVVGETVTLELTRGSDDFSGQASIVGADGTTYASGTLQITVQNARKLSFVVPPDVAPGPATVKVGRKGGGPTYDVPLSFSRLALTLDQKGVLDILPLPPSGLTAGQSLLGTGTAPGLISLSPDGGTLAILVADQLRLQSMAAQPKDLSAAINQTDAKCLTALKDGLLVGTSTQVSLLKHVKDKGITRQGDFTISGCKDIAVDDAGTTALVLHAWDSNSDTTADADAITEISLGTSATVNATQKLDSTISALGVRLAGDGKTAVVVDGSTLYGLTLKGSGQFDQSTLAWGQTITPVALARSHGLVTVSGRKVHIYAVVDSTRSLIRFAGLDGTVLKWVYRGQKLLEVDLSTQGTPSAIAFGRKLELYAAVGNALYRVDQIETTPRIISLGLTTQSTISKLQVQP